MAQTKYAAVPGADVITAKTLDQNGNDITAQCTYTAKSNGTAVTVGTITGNTINVSNVAGTDTLTVSTADAGFEVPDVVLAATVTAPPTPGITTLTSQTGVIS
jgi:hypothetical protein